MRFEKIRKTGIYTYYKSVYNGKTLLFRMNSKKQSVEIKLTNAMAQSYGYPDRELMVLNNPTIKGCSRKNGTLPKWVVLDGSITIKENRQ